MLDSYEAAQKHSISLSSGRTLNYYTFDDSGDKDESYPVLYLHGFPGSGLEAATCAPAVASKGAARLFGLDRHGLGDSDEIAGTTTLKERYEEFCKDVWELTTKLEWSKFSIIAVSGGGPYALALLESYLSTKPPSTILERVVVVAGVCCSAGASDMMPTNQTLCQLASAAETSAVSRFQIRSMFTLSHYLSKVLPDSWLQSMMPTKELPEVDRQLLENNPQASMLMLQVFRSALANGSSGAIAEACTVFRPKQEWEDSLQQFYAAENTDNYLPQVHIFQGSVDKNVPFSHGKFMHETLLSGKSSFHPYDDMGHLSLIVEKSQDYVDQAVPEG